jgi:hypothetical protein
MSTKPHHPTVHLVVLAALLFVCPAAVFAVSISEYQQNLKNAIAALGTLSDLEENETTTAYEQRFEQTIANIRTTLPRNQTVESGADVSNVDNTWLHRALDELKEQVDRPAKIEEIIQSLEAIEARVAERQQQAEGLQGKDQAKTRLESILARPEYASGARGPNALTRLLQDLFRWIQKLFPKRTPGEPRSVKWLNTLFQIVVVAAGLLVIFFVVKLLLSRFKRSGRIKPRKKEQPRIVLGERLEPEQTSTDLLSEAEALARHGELRAAIRKAYIALLVELGDRKMISLAQHKTNRDYLNSVRSVPQLHSNLRALTDSFERHWYGFAQASQNDWQDFRAGYLAALQSGN